MKERERSEGLAACSEGWISHVRQQSHYLETALLRSRRLGPPDSPFLARFYDEAAPAFFVVGYGATRRVESAGTVEIAARKRRALRYQRVAGLFEEYIGLTPLAAWVHSGKAANRAEEIV